MIFPLRRVARLDDVADAIRDGDLLLWRGRDWRSRLISIATRSGYTHAALACRETSQESKRGEPFAAEMTFAGGHLVDLASQVREWPGEWEWRPVRKNFEGEYDGAGAAAVMRNIAGNQYSRRDLWGVALEHLPLVRCFVAPNDGDDVDVDGLEIAKRPAFCSEAVKEAARIGGRVNPVPGRMARLTEPADLAHSLLWDAERAVVLMP